jgi:hypothetical protein
MLKFKSCPFCKSKSFDILYKNSHHKNARINFECTSHNFQSNRKCKPTLYKCKSCYFVFSEYIVVKFQNNYKTVVDAEYLKQLKLKINRILNNLRLTNYDFFHFIMKINLLLMHNI